MHLSRCNHSFQQGPDLVRSDSSHSGAQGETSHGVAVKALDSGAWIGVGGRAGLERRAQGEWTGFCDGETRESGLGVRLKGNSIDPEGQSWEVQMAGGEANELSDDGLPDGSLPSWMERSQTHLSAVSASHPSPHPLPSLVSLGSCWRTKRRGNFRERQSHGPSHPSKPRLPGGAARQRCGMAGRKPDRTSLFMVGISACVGIFMPGHSINGSQSIDEALGFIQMGRFGASCFVIHFFFRQGI